MAANNLNVVDNRVMSRELVRQYTPLRQIPSKEQEIYLFGLKQSAQPVQPSALSGPQSGAQLPPQGLNPVARYNSPGTAGQRLGLSTVGRTAVSNLKTSEQKNRSPV